MTMIRTITKGVACLMIVAFLMAAYSNMRKYTPQVHKVQIKGMKFVPAELVVKKGDVVIWTNMDMVVHDVTEQKSKAWASPPLTSGKSWKKTVTQSDDYYCSIHVVMKGRLKVK